MRFIVEHAGTSIESFKLDKMTEMDIGLLIKDTWHNVFYKTTVTVKNEQLIPAREDEQP